MLYFVLLPLNSNLNFIGNRFKEYYIDPYVTDAMFITTDVLENDRLYFMIIQESLGKTNKLAPSFALIYLYNGIWTNLQKVSGSKISSITQSGGKITVTLSEKRYMYIGILGLGY